MNSLAILGCPSKPSVAVKKTPTTVHVEQLSKRVAECINARNWSDPVFEHFAPSFEAFVEHSEIPTVRSAKEYFEAYSAIVAGNPEYGNELLSISSVVNEKAGTATVWLLLRIFGHPQGMIKESVTIAHLARRNGKWFFTRQFGIRGIQMDD